MVLLKRKTEYSDNYYTPDYAMEVLLPYLDKNKVIYDPCDTSKNITSFFNKKGYKTIRTTTNYFITPEPEYDIQITNPPYSIKDEWLKKTYENGKPFALLVPIYILEGKFRHELFKKYGFEILIPSTRVSYTSPEKKTTSPSFLSVWLCWKLLPEKIILCSLEKNKNEKLF